MAYSTRSDYYLIFTLANLNERLIEDIRWWDTILSWLDRRCPLTGSLPGFTFAVGETLSPLNPLTWVALGIVIILSVVAIRYKKSS